MKKLRLSKIALIVTIVLWMTAFAVMAMLLLQTQPTITKTAEVTLTLNPSPDFTLEVLPEHIESFINREIAYTASVTSVNNFAGDVVFSISGVPGGITVTMFPDNTLTLGTGETKGIQINLAIPLDESLIGTHTLTITAESTVYN